MLDENAVHGQKATLIASSRILVGSEGGVAGSDEEAFVGFEVPKT
jgi:hypothetical protein